MTDQPFPTAPPGRTPPAFVSGLLPQRSLGLKLILVCGLALIMAIPALFVYGVVRERTIGQTEAAAAVSEGVGGAQSVLGPVLTVPFERTPNPARPGAKTYGLAVVYAETGNAVVSATVAERTRGIYRIPVFNAEIGFTATFDPAALRTALPADATPLWAEARLLTGVSDTRGIRDQLVMRANGTALAVEPAGMTVAEPGAFTAVPYAGVSLAAARFPAIETLDRPFSVESTLRLSGAEQLSIGPFAKDTRVAMNSDWPDPSFIGGVLPDTHNAGEGPGFRANWRVAYLARNIPGAGANLDVSAVTQPGIRDMGVRFMREANPYQSVERALKYAAMFVGLVFLAYFLMEVMSGSRAHPAQYILVGLAQAIFYLLLLAFAERYGFDIAFAAAAAMTVLLTSAYAMSVFRSFGYGLRALAILSGIYLLNYVLMRAEGAALLSGALASFAAIALTMYVTRNVDWYGDGRAARAT